MRALKRLWFNLLRSIAATLLNWIPNDQPHGTRLFNALCRHGWYNALEAVLLREGSDDELEVYMTQRGPYETFPGEWHVPGTILRSADNGPVDAFKRLAERELRTPITSCELVGEHFNPKEGRGKCLHLIHLLMTGEEPKGGGKWHAVRNLPQNTIWFHRDHIIPIALAAYRAKQN